MKAKDEVIMKQALDQTIGPCLFGHLIKLICYSILLIRGGGSDIQVPVKRISSSSFFKIIQ